MLSHGMLSNHWKFMISSSIRRDSSRPNRLGSSSAGAAVEACSELAGISESAACVTQSRWRETASTASWSWVASGVTHDHEQHLR